MSLVIHTIVKDGIVVSADSRTTCTDGNKNVRYDDTAEKIIPFPNRIVVSHTGDASITDKLNVTTFLLRLRKKLGLKVSLTELPLALLNEYLKFCNNKIGNTEFLISGCGEDVFSRCKTYRVKSKEKTVEICRDIGTFGASLSGTSDIAYKMMNGADYDNMSLKEAIDLTEATLSTNIIIYKYRKPQIIGGETQTYIIDAANLESGWVKHGNVVPDNNAPDYGYQIYNDRMVERMMRQREVMKGQKQSRKTPK